jgi:hypothetical protein
MYQQQSKDPWDNTWGWLEEQTASTAQPLMPSAPLGGGNEQAPQGIVTPPDPLEQMATKVGTTVATDMATDAAKKYVKPYMAKGMEHVFGKGAEQAVAPLSAQAATQVGAQTAGQAAAQSSTQAAAQAGAQAAGTSAAASALGSAAGPIGAGAGDLAKGNVKGAAVKAGASYAGATVGSVFGPVGTAVGGFIGGMIPSLFGYQQGTSNIKGYSSGSFDPAAYLAINSDVAAAGMDPWEHYQQYGMAEGRNTGAPLAQDDWMTDSSTAYANLPGYFDWQKYVAANSDLGQAGIDTKEEAMRHYSLFGQGEGRNLGLDGSLSADMVSKAYQDSQQNMYASATGNTQLAQQLWDQYGNDPMKLSQAAYNAGVTGGDFAAITGAPPKIMAEYMGQTLNPAILRYSSLDDKISAYKTMLTDTSPYSTGPGGDAASRRARAAEMLGTSSGGSTVTSGGSQFASGPGPSQVPTFQSNNMQISPESTNKGPGAVPPETLAAMGSGGAGASTGAGAGNKGPGGTADPLNNPQMMYRNAMARSFTPGGSEGSTQNVFTFPAGFQTVLNGGGGGPKSSDSKSSNSNSDSLGGWGGDYGGGGDASSGTSSSGHGGGDGGHGMDGGFDANGPGADSGPSGSSGDGGASAAGPGADSSEGHGGGDMGHGMDGWARGGILSKQYLQRNRR